MTEHDDTSPAAPADPHPAGGSTPPPVSAEETVAAPAAALFALLADPARHPEIDGGANVAAPVDPVPLTAAGETFRMDNATGVRVECTVHRFERDRVIAWEPGRLGEAPSGQVWTWELEPLGQEATRVRLTYDGTGIAPEDEKRLVRARAVTPERLAGSIRRLAGSIRRPAEDLRGAPVARTVSRVIGWVSSEAR